MLNGRDAFGKVLSIKPTESAGMAIDGNYNYPVAVSFLAGYLSDEADRGIMYGEVQENDTFALTGDCVIPAPVGAGAASISETVDFHRYIDDGAGGELDIQCILAPALKRITYAVATEADLSKGLVTVTRVGNEWVIKNGAWKFQTRHDEASNKGYIECWYYNATAWVQVGNLRVFIQKTGQSLQEITVAPPDVWPFFSGDPERQMLRLGYPATATDANVGMLEIELDRGRAYGKFTLYNGDSTDKTKCEYRLSLVPTDFRYWTASTTEQDATSAAHGTPDTVAGDADTVNASWVHTTTGAPAAATILTGWARKKQVDCDHNGNDAGDYWDYLSESFDNVTIGQNRAFEPVWLFGGRYDKIGSRTAAQLASEVLDRVTLYQTIIPRV
jgi:hypothetical protein